MLAKVLALSLAALFSLGVVLAQHAAVDTIYVFTDRFVYRQGMVVVINVLVRDAEGVPLGGVDFYVSMTDPLDQVVFERVAKTWANGSFVTYAVLGGDFSEGYYKIEAVALVDIIPTPSSTINILVCRICVQYDNVSSKPPSVVTVTETEFIPLTTTVSVVRTFTTGALTVRETSYDTVTQSLTRTVTLTAVLEVNPYAYVPGLAVLAFAGYTTTLLIIRKYRVRKS